MTHKYKITGMTCSSCEDKVEKALKSVQHVTDVEVSKTENTAKITMDKHIDLTEFQKVLDSKYQISEINIFQNPNIVTEEKKSWFNTYKPVLMIFFYITLVTLLVQLTNNSFDFNQWMSHFMAGFFLVFSFFKMLNLKGFADSYKMYDVVAKQIPIWAYLYAFLELSLGIAYLINFNPVLTNGITFVVMSISLIGVLQSVLNKKKIQCACLGAVFDLPMSSITIIEDLLMIIMSGFMLMMLF